MLVPAKWCTVGFVNPMGEREECIQPLYYNDLVQLCSSRMMMAWGQGFLTARSKSALGNSSSLHQVLRRVEAM